MQTPNPWNVNIFVTGKNRPPPTIRMSLAPGNIKSETLNIGKVGKNNHDDGFYYSLRGQQPLQNQTLWNSNPANSYRCSSRLLTPAQCQGLCVCMLFQIQNNATFWPHNRYTDFYPHPHDSKICVCWGFRGCKQFQSLSVCTVVLIQNMLIFWLQAHHSNPVLCILFQISIQVGFRVKGLGFLDITITGSNLHLHNIYWLESKPLFHTLKIIKRQIWNLFPFSEYHQRLQGCVYVVVLGF